MFTLFFPERDIFRKQGRGLRMGCAGHPLKIRLLRHRYDYCLYKLSWQNEIVIFGLGLCK